MIYGKGEINMKKIKKLLLLTACIAVVGSVTACGNRNVDGTNNSTNKETTNGATGETTNGTNTGTNAAGDQTENYKEEDNVNGATSGENYNGTTQNDNGGGVISNTADDVLEGTERAIDDITDDGTNRSNENNMNSNVK